MWLEKARLAVRRPGSLPFAVELTPVSEALVVAGVIADPLEHASEPKVLESAILYVTREDWARVQDEFEALAGQVRIAQSTAAVRRAAAVVGARAAARPMPSICCRANSRASTDYGARWRQWRTAALLAAVLLAAHVAAGALQIHQANHETAALDAQIAQLFSQVMPAEKMQDPRRQMESRLERIRRSGAGPGILPAHAAGAERRGYRRRRRPISIR